MCHERYDFVINADQISGSYQMRFAGLFDCAFLKAHGEAVLLYDNNFETNRQEILLRAASSNKTESSYKNSSKERLPLLNPLNYASNTNSCSKPSTKNLKSVKSIQKSSKKSKYVSITDLESLESETPTGILFLMQYNYQRQYFPYR